MKYLVSQRIKSDWSPAEEQVINDAISFVQNPPTEDIYIKTALFLYRAIGVDYVTVGQTVTEDKRYITTLAFSYKDKLLDNITYCTIGAPCENVLGHNFCFYPDGIQEMFPTDEALRTMGVHSYMGMPLNDREDNTMGLLALLHSQTIPNPELAEHLLFILASLLEEILIIKILLRK